MAAYPDSDKDWQAEHDCNTLIEAEKIKKDKGRYAAAMKVAKKKHEDLKAVAGEHAMSKKGGDSDSGNAMSGY